MVLKIFSKLAKLFPLKKQAWLQFVDFVPAGMQNFLSESHNI
jgi:hypothetical protein